MPRFAPTPSNLVIPNRSRQAQGGICFPFLPTLTPLSSSAQWMDPYNLSTLSIKGFCSKI
jgi:hypothetical protein